jgi:hypothetical protein
MITQSHICYECEEVDRIGVTCGDGKVLLQKKNVILMGEAKLPKKCVCWVYIANTGTGTCF